MTAHSAPLQDCRQPHVTIDLQWPPTSGIDPHDTVMPPEAATELDPAAALEHFARQLHGES